MSSFVTRLSSTAALVLAAGLLAGAEPQSSEGARGASNAPPVKIFNVDPNAPDENPPGLTGIGRTPLAAGRAPQAIVPNYFYYLRLPGYVYTPRASGGGYASGGPGCVYQTASGTSDFITPLDLPEGALLRYLRIYFNDTSASDLTAWVTRYDNAGNFTDLATVNSTGTAGYGFALSADINHVVDPYNYSYALIWRANSNSAALQFCGARVAYYAPADGHFTAIAPCRVLDTRGGAPLGGGWLPPSTERVYTLAGNCGIPTTATGVSLNATVTQVAGSGFLSLWQTGTTYPTVSTLNFNLGETQVNAAIVPLNASGQLSVALGVNGAHVILDVNGYYY